MRLRTLGSYVGIPKQTEMLIMSVCALWVNIFDMAIFELSSNLEQVWSVDMDITKVPIGTQHIIRTVLSGIVLVRTFTLHVYIAFLIALFWPASFGTRPTLMLPWLMVGAVKNIGTAIVSLVTGLYTCLLFGPFRPACLRFVVFHIMHSAPSFYMWIVGLSLYRDMKKPQEVEKLTSRTTEEDLVVALRRRKVKSMVDENVLRNEFEAHSSAVVVEDVFKHCSWDTIYRKKFRSLDSLLEVLVAEAEMQETEEFEPLEEGLSVAEKTAKLLGLSASDIIRIKQNRQTRDDFPIYPVILQKKFGLRSNELLLKDVPILLVTETSLYTPNFKPIRPTKSELKSPGDFLKLQSPSDFMQNIPEREVRTSDYFGESSQKNLNQKVTEIMPPNVACKSSSQQECYISDKSIVKKLCSANESRREVDVVYNNEDFQQSKLEIATTGTDYDQVELICRACCSAMDSQRQMQQNSGDTNSESSDELLDLRECCNKLRYLENEIVKYEHSSSQTESDKTDLVYIKAELRNMKLMLENLRKSELCSDTFSISSSGQSSETSSKITVRLMEEQVESPQTSNDRISTNVQSVEVTKDVSNVSLIKVGVQTDDEKMKEDLETRDNFGDFANKMEIPAKLPVHVFEHTYSEMGCQASTISKKFLQKDKLFTTKKNRSRTIVIQPPVKEETRSLDVSYPADSKLKNTTNLVDSKSNLTDLKSKSLDANPADLKLKNMMSVANSKSSQGESSKLLRSHKETSYLGIHMHRKEFDKRSDSKVNIDKFGIVPNRMCLEDGYSRLYKRKAFVVPSKENEQNQPGKRREKRKLENAAFKF